MSSEDVIRTQQIASVRIHLERAINRIENHKMWKGSCSSKFVWTGQSDVEYFLRVEFFFRQFTGASHLHLTCESES